MAGDKTGIYKFDEIKQNAYLDALSEGCTRTAAAARAGVTRQTVFNHRNRDEGFSDKESLAELAAVGEVENALFMAAISGNPTAIQVYLYNRAPEQWADKRQAQIQHSGRIDSKDEKHYHIVQEVVSDPDVAARVREHFRRRTGERPRQG